MTEELSDRELRRLYLKRFGRPPALAEAQPPRRRLSLLDIFMYGFIIVLGSVALWVVFAPPTPTQPTPHAAPTPYPTAPSYQPASVPQAAPQIIYRDAPAALPVAPQATAGAVVVVTPTYPTGCHDGVAYVNGVTTNGSCAGAAYAPEEATVTVEPMAATAVPPDPAYLQTIKDQQPHKIR